MKAKLILFTLLLSGFAFTDAVAQQLPLVYDVENTAAGIPLPYLPAFSELPIVQPLPDPFMWADGRGRIAHFSDWRYRRAEINAQIQNYEIGIKPPKPDSITASYSSSDSMLRVNVYVNGQMLGLASKVYLPAGPGPFPAVIGMNSPSGSLPSSIFTSRNIARITYSHNQVTVYYAASNSDPFYRLYPTLNLTNTGQYVAWSWGVSRLIDGLELVKDSLPIDLKHLAVTGCSYAGKMALYAGALDERIALTMAIESGGGGATSWRYSHAEPAGTVECIDNTNYDWFMNSMSQFSGDNVWRMPEDHHELMAMVAPRALYATANPNYTWLSNPSSDVCSRACQQVYSALGISDRFGFSIVGGHDHCAVPASQTPEIEAFVNKFLLGDTTANTNISDSPYSINLTPWITWTNPTLTTGSSFFGHTSLVYPANLQKGLDTTVTLQWNKINSADKYFIQLSADPTFASNVRRDSTTSDTAKTIGGLISGKRYYWRVQVDSGGSVGPWSNVWNFSTYIPLPPAPELVSAINMYPGRADYVILKWRPALYADQYVIQMGYYSDFLYNFYTDSTASDTFKVVSGLAEGSIYYWRVQAKNVSGASAWSDSSFTNAVTSVSKDNLPKEYSISQSYPNPFNPSAKIDFALPKSALTRITIYDVLGREIRTLLNKELGAGFYEVTVDASTLPSGIYFYRIQSGDFNQTRKMVLTK